MKEGSFDKNLDITKLQPEGAFLNIEVEDRDNDLADAVRLYGPEDEKAKLAMRQWKHEALAEVAATETDQDRVRIIVSMKLAKIYFKAGYAAEASQVLDDAYGIVVNDENEKDLARQILSLSKTIDGTLK